VEGRLMPVLVRQTTVKGKKRWSVVEEETGKVRKTYSDKAKAEAYASALNIAYARGRGVKIPRRKS